MSGGENTHHHHRVELLQTRHVLQENRDDAAALHRLDRAAQQVRRDRFEVLEHQHSVGLTENVLGVLVVAPADLRARHEQVERVLAVLIVQAATDQLLDLSHTLLLVSMRERYGRDARAEPQVLLVAPQHGRTSSDAALGKHVVEVRNLLPDTRPRTDYLILSIVSDDNHQRALIQLHSILNERTNTTVDLFLDHCLEVR